MTNVSNNRTLAIKNKIKKKRKYLIVTMYALAMIIFGLSMDSPQNIIKGIFYIIVEPDTLITDYIGVGGIGAAFVNAGLLILAFSTMLNQLKIELNGIALAALFVIGGFGFFGKNIFNVWFIVFGVYLFSKVQRDRFTKYIYIALFGTTLAPLVTELMFTIDAPLHIRIPLATFTGLAVGFILPPLSSHLLRVHQGFNLYNIGFTAGIIGTVFVSVFRSYGVLPETRMVWTTEYTTILSIFFIGIFLSMVAIGYFLNDKSFKGIKSIMNYPGRLVTDYVLLEGFPVTLINMGLCGILAILYILLMKGDLNGPTLAGVLTIVGFSAFGKHPKNIFPIFLGVYLGSLTQIWSINDPSIVLAALFGTALAPIAGEFGWKYGVIAGFLHSAVVSNVGILYGGLNLYNNGFAGGIVAALMVPVIEAFRKDEY